MIDQETYEADRHALLEVMPVIEWGSNGAA